MIQISQDQTKVAVKFELSIGYNISFSNDRQVQMDAKLLQNQINNDLHARIEKIRKEAYELGWKEKSAKKGPKKTWFNGNINSDHI